MQRRIAAGLKLPDVSTQGACAWTCKRGHRLAPTAVCLVMVFCWCIFGAWCKYGASRHLCVLVCVFACIEHVKATADSRQSSELPLPATHTLQVLVSGVIGKWSNVA
eukprot:1158877-Pelagomonas_calceolata.AAC.3